MFRITEDPSSGNLLQCLAKNYKNDSIVSVDMSIIYFYYLCIFFYQVLFNFPVFATFVMLVDG